MRHTLLLFLIVILCICPVFGQHFNESKIFGAYIQTSDSSNSIHTISKGLWTRKNRKSNINYSWKYKFEIEKQTNNQPDLFHEYLILTNKDDSLILDIVNYWSDTLIFYNINDKEPWFLIKIKNNKN